MLGNVNESIAINSVDGFRRLQLKTSLSVNIFHVGKNNGRANHNSLVSRDQDGGNVYHTPSKWKKNVLIQLRNSESQERG